ncbi:hypothetical protein B1P96_08570, partial [Enterococcus faecium]
ITKNLSQNVVHSDSDLILHNSSVLIDKEPQIDVTLPYYLQDSFFTHLGKRCSLLTSRSQPLTSL